MTDSVRDSDQAFVFGKVDSGEKVDEKSAIFAFSTLFNYHKV